MNQQKRVREVSGLCVYVLQDHAFLEKKERCDYLKEKLSHIKHRIRTFDEETSTRAK